MTAARSKTRMPKQPLCSELDHSSLRAALGAIVLLALVLAIWLVVDGPLGRKSLALDVSLAADSQAAGQVYDVREDVHWPETAVREGVEHKEEAALAAIDPGSDDPQELEECGFHQHRSLPDASICSEMVEFNPTGKELTAEELVRLSAIINQINKEAAELESRKLALARTWARTRVEMGQFDFLPPERAVLPEARGAIRVVIQDNDGMPARLVDVYPGENAEIDVAANDIESALRGGRLAIQAFFAGNENSLPHKANR
jgi:hypothetical protein